MNIYVGNLSGDVGDDDLRQAFEAFGQTASVTIIKDKFSGESRGFGFVEMPSKDEAQAAMAGLDGTDINGQTLNVNEARPRRDNRRGGGGPGGGRRFQESVPGQDAGPTGRDFCVPSTVPSFQNVRWR